jgi:geranylgeranyl diphosphate synthase, type III
MPESHELNETVGARNHSDQVVDKVDEDRSVSAEKTENTQGKQPQHQQKQQQQQQHEADKSLLEPFYYINSVPGKNIRSLLIDCFQVWFQVDKPDVLDSIKDIIGDLHNASLLVDDIEDNSRLRRGIPVAHAIFGIPTVLNCANYVYFLALQKCQALANTNAMAIFIEELLNLHRGQGYDITWREMSRCPSEKEYISMVQDKTGGLFRLAVGLLQSFATKHVDTDFTSFVNNLGLYFQIRDDYINLADEEYFRSKTFCEDITEGKFSYPIVHCINTDETNSIRLVSILKQRTEDVDVKRYAQRLMKDSGSLDYTRTTCRKLKEEICTDINKFGDNPALIQAINKLHVQLDKLDDTSDQVTSSTSDQPQNQQNVHRQIDTP